MEVQIHDLIEKAIHEAAAIRSNLLKATDWKDLGESEGVQAYQREEGNIVYIKSKLVVNFPPQVVADFIWNPAKFAKLDENQGFFNVLHHFGDTRIVHHQIKLPWPVDNRDMVDANKMIRVGDDIHLLARGIELDAPLGENTVRAFVELSSYYLENIEDIATDITFIGGSNPRGDIPQLIVDHASRHHAFHLSKIREALNE